VDVSSTYHSAVACLSRAPVAGPHNGNTKLKTKIISLLFFVVISLRKVSKAIYQRKSDSN
jgi:hypothetical protein